MEKISFVILTWNSEKHIKQCINSIQQLKKFKYEIIIIDNGSKDNTINFIEEKKINDKNIRLVKLDKNYGTTISRNKGLQIIDSPTHICILDSDTIINENAIERMVFFLNSDMNIGIIGPKLVTSNGIIQNSGRNLPSFKEKFFKAIPIKKIQKIGEKFEIKRYTKNQNIKIVGYLMSACWLMRKDFLIKNGVLDEKIFYAPEDAEYCTRAWKNGYKIAYVEDVEIIHEWQRLSKKRFFSKINFEHIKGLIYYWNKYNIKKINGIIEEFEQNEK